MKVVVIATISLVIGIVVGALAQHRIPSQPQASKKEPPHPLASLAHKTGRQWDFPSVIEGTSGHQVIPLELADENHQVLQSLILKSAERVRLEMSQENSPVRGLKRINEASRFFEDRLKTLIEEEEGFTCTIPLARSGKKQRSGYPDLRIEHQASGTVAYLDPKLFEEKSIHSSFRTFYYEPNQETLKINENALHLLLGFAHDGKSRAWTFTEVHLVDLSEITLKLKTEFSASNRELYRK